MTISGKAVYVSLGAKEIILKTADLSPLMIKVC